jgi:hypothetical protein
MRKIILAGLLVLGSFGVARSSEGVDEILKLAAAGVGEEVLLAFVETSPVAYDISVDEIIQLKDLGLPQTVLAAMLTRGNELRKVAAEAGGTTATINPPASPQEQGDEIAARTPAPESFAPPVTLPAPVPTQPTVTQPVTQFADPNTQPVYTYQPAVDAMPTTVVLDTAPVVAPAPGQYTTTFFYDALSPYGTWVSDPGYGWVWEPAAVRLNPYWRPYCDGGYWVWTDHGWYWQSDYSWGWAPFHYGRWTYLHHRWCWVPGHTWAPSWVYWRSYDEGYGWAPLPPSSHFDSRFGFSFHGKNVDFSFGFNLCDNDYVFVPRNRFLDHRLHSYALPRNHVTNIYNRTTVIKNTYIYKDNRIINNGIPVNSLAEATHQRIQPVKIEDARFKPGERIHGDRRDGDRIVAFRPEVQDKVTELPPAVTKRRLDSIPPSKRVTLAPPKATAKTGPAQVLGPATTNLAPAGTQTLPATTAKLPAVQDPATLDRSGRKPPPVATNPDAAKSLNPEIKQPANETRRRIETETGKVDLRGDRERPPVAIDRRSDEKLQTEQDAARNKAAEAEAARKVHLDNTRKLQLDAEAAKRNAGTGAEALKAQRDAALEAARRKADADALKAQQDAAKQAQLEALRKAELDAARQKADTEGQAKAQRNAALEAAKRKAEADTLKAQQDAAKQAQLEALRKANLDAARRKADAEAQARTQRDAALEAARRKAESDALKAQQDAAKQAQLDALRKAELDAARRKSETDLKAQREAAQQQAQMEAARKAEQEAARQKAQNEAAWKLQRDAARQNTQNPAPRTVDPEPVRRRVEVPVTKQPVIVTPTPVAPNEQVPAQPEDDKTRRGSER